MARLPDATPVPRHIDRDERSVEYLIALFGCFYGLQVFIGPAKAMLTGIVVALAYARLTAGQPPGFLVQAVLYGRLRLAVVDALLDPRAKTLRP